MLNKPQLLKKLLNSPVHNFFKILTLNMTTFSFSQKGGGLEHTLLKTPGIFRFVTLPSEIPHNFSLVTPGNSTSFLLTPGISKFYFFNIPGISMALTYLFGFFSGIAQYKRRCNFFFLSETTFLSDFCLFQLIFLFTY